MLIGISLGPGDPELMTLKAVAALKRCKKVFVPGEKAAELIRPYFGVRDHSVPYDQGQE